MRLSDYVRARARSFKYAFRGILFLLKFTPNARIHLLATVVVTTFGIVLCVSAGEWALLALSMGMVWTAEGMNSALESLTDLASPDRHPLAGNAKDLAAGAVLLAAIFAAVVAVCVFLPKFI